MLDKRLITAILVPQGAEYQAVCRGLRKACQASGNAKTIVPVVPIPMGIAPVKQYLQTQTLQFLQSQFLQFKVARPQVLVMGLCGSLTPDLRIGDAVICESCIPFTRSSQPLNCDSLLTHQLLNRLEHCAVRTVTALTSDRFIHSAQEKRSLGQTWKASVVDMEGTAILETLEPAETAVAMLRVVSDDCQQDMPDLSEISSPKGAILPNRLAIALMRQPVAGMRLVRGSLKGLRSLENLTCELFG